MDQKIADLILKHLDVETESAYEVGFGSGHYMAFFEGHWSKRVGDGN